LGVDPNRIMSTDPDTGERFIDYTKVAEIADLAATDMRSVGPAHAQPGREGYGGAWRRRARGSVACGREACTRRAAPSGAARALLLRPDGGASVRLPGRLGDARADRKNPGR
ncbi:hypothetical protein, partial [Oerskovia enterophila]